MSERIVIVGASLAGLNAASGLREQGFDGEVVVVGDEPHMPYDRPPLSKQLLAGEWGPDDVALARDAATGVEWRLGTPALAVDLDRRVVAVGAAEIPFDALVIASGARPRLLPSLPAGSPRVHVLRTYDDALRLRAALQPGARLLIVGAGFIGVEVATAARAAGCDVVIASLDPPVAVAGRAASGVCAELLREAGVELRLGRTVVRAEGGDEPWAVVLDDGTRIAFDAALVAVGATPNVEWLAGSGLTLDDGVVCDASLAAVGGMAVVAAGDVARWPNATMGGRAMRVEHWTNAVEQGAAAARTLLLGPGPHTAHGSVPDFWSDHAGTRLQSVGVLRDAVRFEVVEGSLHERRFAAAAYDAEGSLVGGVAYGVPRAIVAWRMALAEQDVAA